MMIALRTILQLGITLAIFCPAQTSRGEDWKLVWHDEFDKDGPPDPANWKFEQGFVRNHELQWYQPQNAYCANGMLILEGRREHRANPGYLAGSDDWRRKRPWIDVTSACLTTQGLHEFTYGKFEMRARVDTRAGSWPAFWTLGDRPGVRWPACGEVDIMEFYASQVLANIGWKQAGKTMWLSEKEPVAQLSDPNWSSEFHTWTMDWEAQKIDLLLDGKLMKHLDLTRADAANEGNPFHSPAYILLDQAIGGNCGGDSAHTTFPIRYEIDWVRVYQQEK
ncbi:MAG TPA: glycoside hydrolase family 16 protein [Chthoniobacteraceae bacterium]|jgi:beta-glucanase (GH16 family)|nr:glycoside hydrolase family 16 protein [Chthoniobacteraceae bacterium]